MNRYDEFPDVPAYMMADDTDPSLIPDPDALDSDDTELESEDDVNLEDVVKEIDDERKDDDGVDTDDDDLVAAVEDEDEDVLDVEEEEEDDEVIT